MLAPLDQREQFHRDGFTVFEEAIPTCASYTGLSLSAPTNVAADPGSMGAPCRPLLHRLRAACHTARELARESNPNAQRLQPVASQEDNGLYQQPFVEYGQLTPLRAAVAELLSSHGQDNDGFGDRNVFGILIEPRDEAYAFL